MNISREEIIAAFEGHIPNGKAHDLVMSYSRPSVEEVLKNEPSPRESSVIFLLYPIEEEWHFLLLKRHDYKGVHAGQVGLPGGSLEQGESEVAAGLREFEEETGLALSSRDIISRLSPLYIPPSNFVVYPYMAIIENQPKWKFDAHEVKRGIEVPLVELLQSGSLKETRVKMSGAQTRIKVNAFVFEEETVWGATAMMLSECKQILLTLAP